MKIIAISGDGQGAGKTFLAAKVTHPSDRFSVAGALRDELTELYPAYAWENRTQSYKDNTVVHETGKTVRQTLIEYGSAKREEDPDYWINRLIYRIEMHTSAGGDECVITIDDIRYANEIAALRREFGDSVTHIHVESSKAKEEPDCQNEHLLNLSDYNIWSSAHA